MFLFLIFGIPLGFALLVVLLFPRDEMQDWRRALLRGLVSAIPVWIVSRFLGSLIPAAWGSPLLVFHEWFDRFLPYSVLPALCYAVFYHYSEKLARGRRERRFTAFYAGTLSPIGIGEMTRYLISPDFYGLIVLPSLLFALVLGVPLMIAVWIEAWTFRRVLLAFAFVGGTLALSTPAVLLLARYWPLALLVSALAIMGSLWIAFPRLAWQAPIRASR
jgi:hypothetical protein